MTSPSAGDALAICSAVRAELVSRLSRGAGVVYGPDAQFLDVPAVYRLQARGAHFFWVAVGFPRISFWELHVGIVVDPATLRARAGLHRSVGYTPGRELFMLLEPQRVARGLDLIESVAADEVQIVGPEYDGGLAPIGALCDEAEALLRWGETALCTID